MQSSHGAWLNVKSLCVVSHGGENELHLLMKIHAKNIRTRGVGSGAYLGATEMNVYIRYGFTSCFIGDVSNDDRLCGYYSDGL